MNPDGIGNFAAAYLTVESAEIGEAEYVSVKRLRVSSAPGNHKYMERKEQHRG